MQIKITYANLIYAPYLTSSKIMKNTKLNYVLRNDAIKILFLKNCRVSF